VVIRPQHSSTLGQFYPRRKLSAGDCRPRPGLDNAAPSPPSVTAHFGEMGSSRHVIQMNGIPIAVTGTTVTQVVTTRAGSIYCGEARLLLDALADAIHELIQVHEQQFNAIIQGDLDCTRFDLSIFEANRAKNAAKYAYLGHLEEHHCSTL